MQMLKQVQHDCQCLNFPDGKVILNLFQDLVRVYVFCVSRDAETSSA